MLPQKWQGHGSFAVGVFEGDILYKASVSQLLVPSWNTSEKF